MGDRFVRLLQDIDGGVKVISSLTDDYRRSYERKTLTIDKAFVDRYTGIGDAITLEHIETTLKALGFETITALGDCDRYTGEIERDEATPAEEL